MTKTWRFLTASAVASVLSVTALHAQSYPNQPIRLLVPFAPGGGMETAVRSVVQKINESGWPQLIVDNRPGGAGNVAAIATKQAAPDGYTLMLVAISTHAINVSLIPDLKYDPLKDFSPITVLFSYPSIVAVPAGSPARSLADLVEMARKKPGSVNYGSPGVGTLGHILPVMLERATRTQMVHVPYRGGGPAMLDLLAGRIDFMILNPSGIMPNVESGQLRVLAVTSKARFKDLPDIPTMAEVGYPEVFLDGWFGVAGPAGLPDHIVSTIYEKFASVLNAPDLNQKLASQGWVVDPIAPDQFRELIASEIVRLGKLLKDPGGVAKEGAN